MKMQEVIVIAKEMDIPYKFGMSKADLIQAIQVKEGYTACFRSQEACKEKECLWLDDCRPKCLWLDDCVPAGMQFS